MCPRYIEKLSLQLVDSLCEHLQVVEGCDGCRQITLASVQLTDVPGDGSHPLL